MLGTAARLADYFPMKLSKPVAEAVTLHLSALMSHCGETCMIRRCENLEMAHRALRLGYTVVIRQRPCSYEILFVPPVQSTRDLAS